MVRVLLFHRCNKEQYGTSTIGHDRLRRHGTPSRAFFCAVRSGGGICRAGRPRRQKSFPIHCRSLPGWNQSAADIFRLPGYAGAGATGWRGDRQPSCLSFSTGDGRHQRGLPRPDREANGHQDRRRAGPDCTRRGASAHHFGAFPGPVTREFQYIRNVIARGDLGDIYLVTGVCAQPWLKVVAGTWRTTLDLSGGGNLYDSGAHMFNAMLYLTGLSATEVFAFVDNKDQEVDVIGS